ncbi:MAG: hypothetical protein H6581_30180 [Bacteroidia bacterium]|nr:hypothetical protein [Bacteroidia bacterium]
MNKIVLYFQGILLVFLLGGCATVDLSFQLEKGKTYGLEQSVSQSVRQSGQLFQQSIIFNYDFFVQDVLPSGDMQLRQVLTRVRYEAIYPYGQTEKYDSQTDFAKAPPKVMGDVYVFILNQPFTLTLTPHGRVTAFNGLDSFLEEYFRRMPASQAMQANAIRQQYNNAGFKTTMDNIFHFLPEKPVSEGSSWKIEGKITPSPASTYETKYTLKNFPDQGNPILRVEAPINLEGVQGNILGVDGKMDMQGTKSGSMELDKISHWPVSSSITQTYDGYISNSVSHTAIWVQNVVEMKGRLPAP